MKILIVGYCPQRFVNPIVKELALSGCLIDLLSFKKFNIPEKYLPFYNNVISNGLESYSLAKRLLSSIQNIFQLPLKEIIVTTNLKALLNAKRGQELKNFHIVNIQLLGDLEAWYPYILPKHRLIISFWGTDLLNPSEMVKSRQGKWLRRANKITVQTEDLKKILLDRFSFLEPQKVYTTIFPSNNSIYKYIDQFEKNENAAHGKIKFTLGYNGSKNQNHLDVLYQLDKLDQEVKNKIYLYIPLTYGGDKNYLEKIESFVKKMNIQFNLFKDFLDDKNLARIRKETDVFIHVPTTDAFSSSLLESLYAGNLVISGKWLPYNLLKTKGILYKEVSDFKELPNLINQILLDFKGEKLRVSKNRSMVEEIINNKGIMNKWKSIFTSD